eukprot:jgi/Chrzof1/6305/Cz18g01030.t1
MAAAECHGATARGSLGMSTGFAVSNLCACSRMQELVLGVLEYSGVQHQSFTVRKEHDVLHRQSFSLQLELSWPAASQISLCIRSADGFKHQSLTIATEAGSC